MAVVGEKKRITYGPGSVTSTTLDTLDHGYCGRL
jgi:hypothetical protein